jgi:hypothetical protein
LPADNETYKQPLPEWAEQKRLRRFAHSGKFGAFAMPQATLSLACGYENFVPQGHFNY